MKKQLLLTWTTVMSNRLSSLKRTAITRFDRSKNRRKTRQPVPMLSGASKCVWQMDREA
jgi:hypothetical protein